jgi:DNA-binding NtrC family response regulator
MRMLARMRIEAGEGPDRFTRSTLDWLCNSRWPANIPQLRDVVSESFIRAVGEAEIDTHHVAPSLVARGLHAGNTATETEDWTLGAVERRHVLSVLGMSGQNRSLAARTLGITRTTLYKKLAEYGVEGEA